MNYYFKVFTRKKLFHFSLWDEKYTLYNCIYMLIKFKKRIKMDCKIFLHDYVCYYLEKLTVFYFIYFFMYLYMQFYA